MLHPEILSTPTMLPQPSPPRRGLESDQDIQAAFAGLSVPHDPDEPFVNVHDQALFDQEAPAFHPDDLGLKLRGEFDEVEKGRRLYEEQWLDDYRQYRGVYDDETEKVLAEMDHRSRVFLRLTKVKVDSMKARIMDLLFPANGDRNWAVEPTPEPLVREEAIMAEVMRVMEEQGPGGPPSPPAPLPGGEGGFMQGPGGPPSPPAPLPGGGGGPMTGGPMPGGPMQGPGGPSPLDMAREMGIDLSALKFKVARETCQRMAEEVDDQLVERPGRMSYRQSCEQVVFSGLLAGMGVLKGPLVEYQIKYRWHPSPDGSWGMAADADRDLAPYKEFVPLWNFYPDLEAADVASARYVWQTHLMTKMDLENLSGRPHFDMEAIRAYVREHPDGDATPFTFERELRELSPDESGAAELKDRYRVLERWGYVPARDLADAGHAVPEDRLDFDMPVNIWLLGDRVIRMVPWPMPDLPIPYHCFYFSKGAAGILDCEGVASVARHPQRAVNAAARAMLDNAAISSGPQIGINMAAVAPGEDPRDIFAWKTWLFEGHRDMKEFMAVWELPNYTNNFLQLISFFTNVMDEVTTPRFMHGDANVPGAGQTAMGLSMLMGAAHISIKDLVRNFDDTITRPFITAMYHWNMRFNPREDIKGDYEVKARGSTALVAREVQTERLLQAASLFGNERFDGRLKDEELAKEILKTMEVSPNLVRSDEEFAAYRQQKMLEAAKATAQANLEVLMNEAQSRGIDPNQVIERLIMEQAMAQGGQAAPPSPPGPLSQGERGRMPAPPSGPRRGPGRPVPMPEGTPAPPPF